MPTYGFQCTACGKEFEVVMTIREREERPPVCPACGSADLEPRMESFFAKTSRKG